MKTKLFIVLSLATGLGLHAQNVSIPDSNFKAKLLSASAANTIAKNLNGVYFSIDSNNDGEIQEAEANQVSELRIEENPALPNFILSLTGIERFKTLKNLEIYNCYHVTDLMVTTLPDLKKIVFTDLLNPLSSSQGSLETLNINGCQALEEVNLSGNKLVHFEGWNTGLIKRVNLSYNKLTYVHDLNQEYLEYLDVSHNPQLNSNYTAPFDHNFNIDRCIKLKELYASYCNLSSFEMQNLPKLETVDLNNNVISRVTFQNSLSLKNINLSHNNLSYVNVSGLPSLTTLNLSDNSLKGLSFQDNTANSIQSLNVNNNPLLASICKDNNDTLPSTAPIAQNFCTSPVYDQGFISKLLSADSNNEVAKNNSGQYFKIDSNGDGILQASELSQIKELNLNADSSFSGQIQDIDTYGMTALEKIKYNGPGLMCYGSSYCEYLWGTLSTINVKNSPALKEITLNDQPINSIDVSGLPNLTKLELNISQTIGGLWGPPTGKKLKKINAENCTSLSELILDGYTNVLEDANFENCSALVSLNLSYPMTSSYISYGGLKKLNVNNCTSLQELKAERNDISDLKIANVPNLKTLAIANNHIPEINNSNFPVLESFDASYNQLTALNFTAPLLKTMYVFSNNITNFTIGSYPILETLDIGGNRIVDLDISNHSKITTVYNWIDLPTQPPANLGTYLKSVNANNSTSLTDLILGSSALENIFMKNGHTDNLVINQADLKYICCDESEAAAIKDMVTSMGMTDCNVNTYCNFVPGGNYNTITGTVRFDDNNNGCDLNDEVFEHMKLKVSNGTIVEETFVKSNGKYDLYTQGENFTVTAEPENPARYTVSPPSFAVNFADHNQNVSTQNICVTKNGNVKDLEVVIAPVSDARPGFDAVYKLIWRNKGNVSLSGNASLTFDGSKMTFLSSSLPSTVSGNTVNFSFAGLKPYANTASEITFKINAPTHPGYPVNIGDQLNFTAAVTPLSGDFNPSDNEFIYKQTVTGSFDPNDITCLEGSQIPVSMVSKDLHYIINFENTGTAPATHIVVEMDINPADFNVATLQLQHTSHETYTKITGNKAEFMMKDINLAASAHGNIALKIKTKTGLVSGDSVSGKANIYFDYNFPVATNEAVTVIGGTVLQTLDSTETSGIHIYPNPTKGDVNITADSKITSVEIYDAQGRIVQKQTGIHTEKTKISLHTAASGVYYFKVFTEKDSFMRKVIRN